MLAEETRVIDELPKSPRAARALMAIGSVALLAALGLLLFQCLDWLYGRPWPHYSTASLFRDLGLGYPNVSSPGVQGAIDWVMAASASWPVAIFGLVLWSIGNPYNERYHKEIRALRDRREAREKQEAAGSG